MTIFQDIQTHIDDNTIFLPNLEGAEVDKLQSLVNKYDFHLGDTNENLITEYDGNVAALIDQNLGIFVLLRTNMKDTVGVDMVGQVITGEDDEEGFLSLLKRLKTKVIDVAEIPSVRIWRHNHLIDIADEKLSQIGFRSERTLYKMVRDNNLDHEKPHLDNGIKIRQYRPEDLGQFVKVNNDAFEGHPEQGGWSSEYGRVQLSKDWVSYDDIYIAEDINSGEILGFNWTKPYEENGEKHGEVYVLGIASSAQGQGLGTSLLLHGLEGLKDKGAHAFSLYVDGDDKTAVGLYKKFGFEVESVAKANLYGEDGQS